MATGVIEILQYLFESKSGFLCLSRKNRSTDSWRDEFFRYPEDLEAINDWIKQYNEHDLYFCPHLLLNPKRKKEEACKSRVLWADLDECSPDKLGKYDEPLPNIIIQTSRKHYQAYWKLNKSYSPTLIENLNHRIYEAYRSEGCDSCWALTHVMRLPNTVNHKRKNPFKMKTTIDWGCCTFEDLNNQLPILKTSRSKIKEINTNEKPVCKLNPKQMRMYERHLWFDPVPQGRRSERIYILVRLAKEKLQCNDSGAIELLMDHPVLIDKFPDKKDRLEDIIRCLVKLRR